MHMDFTWRLSKKKRRCHYSCFSFHFFTNAENSNRSTADKRKVYEVLRAKFGHQSPCVCWTDEAKVGIGSGQLVQRSELTIRYQDDPDGVV